MNSENTQDDVMLNVLVHRPPKAVRCNGELGISMKRRFSVSRVQCLLERTAMVPRERSAARQEVLKQPRRTRLRTPDRLERAEPQFQSCARCAESSSCF
jgi:hypothetical protein